MAGFLYFAERTKHPTTQILAELGLADIFPTPPSAVEVTAGPSGPGGVVFAHTSDVGYYPDKQTWAPLPGSTAPRPVWIGYVTAAPPTPLDLIRAELIDGYLVPLGADGPAGQADWIVPTARVFPTGTKLPSALTIGPDGKVVSEALPRFAVACADADRLWDLARADNGLLDEGEPNPEPLDDADAYHYTARILALNYRVGPGEISVLRLLTTTNVRNVLATFVDMPGYLTAMAAQADARTKKNETEADDIGPSDSGPPA